MVYTYIRNWYDRYMYKSHNMYRSITYSSWKAMKARCKYKTVNGYEFYGGRGITYDPAWEKFENFLADMGKRPSKRHQLDRKNNNSNYTKENCQWITRSKNQRKKGLMKNNKSGYVGISYVTSRKKWLVQSRGTGKQIHLGIFTDLDKAIKKWKEYHNEI